LSGNTGRGSLIHDCRQKHQRPGTHCRKERLSNVIQYYRRWLLLNAPAPVGDSRLAIDTNRRAREMKMLWTVVAFLLIMWLLGFSLHLGGGLVHILLVVALVVIVFN